MPLGFISIEFIIRRPNTLMLGSNSQSFEVTHDKFSLKGSIWPLLPPWTLLYAHCALNNSLLSVSQMHQEPRKFL